jgi:hypothetical protein
MGSPTNHTICILRYFAGSDISGHSSKNVFRRGFNSGANQPSILEIWFLRGFSPTHITNLKPKGFSRCEKKRFLKILKGFSQREGFLN